VSNENPLHDQLIRWGHTHKRDFPWRHTPDAYRVFVAEVLLHRTRADQVVPLYLALTERYPDVQALASADKDDLHTLLRGGGLRWRVDALLASAQQVMARYGGTLPRKREQLETLPGVGHYIATAVRCFAYGEAEAIVDTNTVRVIARVIGIKITDGLRRNKNFRVSIEALLDRRRPREFNYALLDLAALICTPRTPKCEECPIVNFCSYGRTVPPNKVMSSPRSSTH
jgi:A/G-specific adenine glycosylase